MQWVRHQHLLAVLTASLLCGCGSIEIEEYDGAYRHHRWGAEGFDFDLTGTIGQHVVLLEGHGTTGSCAGFLVGPDQVWTAAHCVPQLTREGEGGPLCGNFETPGGSGIRVLLDQQFELDTTRESLDGITQGVNRGRVTGAIDVIAGFVPNPSRVFEPDCSRIIPDSDPIDATILTLREPVGSERGWARLRSADPAVGTPLAVVHHPGSVQAKKVMVGRVFRDGALPLLEVEVDGEPSPLDESELVQPGSSGAPVFDRDGYAIGSVQGGIDCVTECTRTRYVRASEMLEDLDIEPRPETPHFLFASIRPDGTLITPRTNFSGPRERALDGARRPDGFVSGGFATVGDGRVLALSGYTSDGRVDTSFGTTGGTQLFDVPDSDGEEYRAVDLFRAAGDSWLFAAGPVADGIVVGRHEPETGALDMAFGDGGLAQLDVTAADGGFLGDDIDGEQANAVEVDGAGRIVVAGHVSGFSPIAQGRVRRPFVARMAFDGSPDLSCGADGIFVWDSLWPANDLRQHWADVVVKDMTLLPGGNVVLTGYIHSIGKRRRLWIGRLDAPDCSPSSSFGRGGRGHLSLDSLQLGAGEVGHVWANGVTRLPSGDLVAAGSLATFDDAKGIFAGRMLLTRFDALGRLVPEFGIDGAAVLDGSGWHEVAHDLTLRGDGNLAVVGRSYRHRDDTDVNRVSVAIVDPGLGAALVRRTPDVVQSTDEWATAVIPSGVDETVVVGEMRVGPPVLF